jgi:polygalacturonase
MSFDGYLKNVVFAFNYVSTGDDDIVLKGSGNPGPKDDRNLPLQPAIDGNRDVRADRAHGVVIAHNHIYWGHGISVGSETNAGVKNVWVYDNTFDGSEEALRIKSDYARGGEVSNFHYKDICIRGTLNALLYTGYYSTRVLPAGGPLYPNFHDLTLENVRILDDTNVRLEGFAANSGGFTNPQFPLVMTMKGVVADRPDEISILASDAELTLDGVNLPILPSASNRVVVSGSATRSVDPAEVVDCSRAFVDFPSPYDPRGKTW